MYNEVEGNLITLAKEGAFDVITHGCNCYSAMGAGIAPQMAKAFGCDEYLMEKWGPSVNKLGCIDWEYFENEDGPTIIVVNSYTQHHFSSKFGPPLDYEALTLCMRKINYQFKGKHIGLPQIGAGLAGGDWERIKTIIQTELNDCNVTVVIYKP